MKSLYRHEPVDSLPVAIGVGVEPYSGYLLKNNKEKDSRN